MPFLDAPSCRQKGEPQHGKIRAPTVFPALSRPRNRILAFLLTVDGSATTGHCERMHVPGRVDTRTSIAAAGRRDGNTGDNESAGISTPVAHTRTCITASQPAGQPARPCGPLRRCDAIPLPPRTEPEVGERLVDPVPDAAEEGAHCRRVC